MLQDKIRMRTNICRKQAISPQLSKRYAVRTQKRTPKRYAAHTIRQAESAVVQMDAVRHRFLYAFLHTNTFLMEEMRETFLSSITTKLAAFLVKDQFRAMKARNNHAPWNTS